MNMEVLKQALLKGVPGGILAWLIYGLVFRALIDKKPLGEALFSGDSLLFLVVVTVVEIVVVYFTAGKKEGKK